MEEASSSGNFDILVQAIKSEEESLIEFLLNKSQPNMIKDLIRMIQPSMINSFIQTFANHIQKRPLSLSKALPWIEEFVDQWQNEIAASSSSQKKIAELQHVLRQRTQQIGIFIEVDALSAFVAHEKEGAGIGLPINDISAQTLLEE